MGLVLTSYQGLPKVLQLKINCFVKAKTHIRTERVKYPSSVGLFSECINSGINNEQRRGLIININFQNY